MRFTDDAQNVVALRTVLHRPFQLREAQRDVPFGELFVQALQHFDSSQIDVRHGLCSDHGPAHTCTGILDGAQYVFAEDFRIGEEKRRPPPRDRLMAGTASDARCLLRVRV